MLFQFLWIYTTVSESRRFLILTEYGVVMKGWNKLAVSSLLFTFGILICHLYLRKDVVMLDH